jgi:hypothetical protein
MTFDRALFLECDSGLIAFGERMRAFKGDRV